MGRAVGKPHIQLCEDSYKVQKLEWFQIYRGMEEAGELLSAFEMFEVCYFHDYIYVMPRFSTRIIVYERYRIRLDFLLA